MMPYPSSWLFHTALLVIKETTSQQIKCSKEPMFMESAGLTMFPTTSAEDDLSEHWNGLFKNEKQYQTGGRTFEAWSKVYML